MWHTTQGFTGKQESEKAWKVAFRVNYHTDRIARTSASRQISCRFVQHVN